MKATNKISDFGQKIGGARKDVYSKYLDRMAAVTNDALILKPLSKVYQIPDLSALWGAGEITVSIHTPRTRSDGSTIGISYKLYEALTSPVIPLL